MVFQFLFSMFLLFLLAFFPFFSHPLSMGVTILTMTMILAISMGLMTVNFWVSYMMILVLLGGLLVIFIYISLLAPNEIFQKGGLKKNLSLLSLMIVSLMFYFSVNLMELKFVVSNFIPKEITGFEWLVSFYSDNLGFLTMFLILYLFLTLIVVVFITKSDFSSLRSSMK